MAKAPRVGTKVSISLPLYIINAINAKVEHTETISIISLGILENTVLHFSALIYFLPLISKLSLKKSSFPPTLISFIPVMLCINHLYIRELLINCSSPFFFSTGFTSFAIAITTTAIITITKVVISGSIIKMVIDIATATTASVNIPSTVVNSA